ncbi:MAG: ferritin-like domain-containing protein [Deltaproteobacteria bacterium]|nr:ferritin-like domain-containing protein [Deltaproteobacteria bacterium]
MNVATGPLGRSLTSRLRRDRRGAFPPYEMIDQHDREHSELLDESVRAAEEKSRKLERLYHNTTTHAWDGKKVLQSLVEKHGGIHVPPDKREALGHTFTVILWGELAAWNVAADLARALPDVDAKLAATGQAFDEARHFYVLRDYLMMSGVPLPPLGPLVRRVLTSVLDAPSPAAKLSGMQLLVENLALAIFRQVADARVEPVLTDLLEYIERDEARHVALGVMYLPKLLERTSRWERMRLWAFSTQTFLLTVGHGRRMDPHWKALGVNHRGLALHSFRLHQQMMRQMKEVADKRPGESIRGVYGLSSKQHQQLIDFLHPEQPESMGNRHRAGLAALDAAVLAAERVLA